MTAGPVESALRLRSGVNSVEDDLHVGRLLRRREALALIGVSGLALLSGSRLARAAADAPGACIARPRQTEGPFFADGALERSDIRSDPATGALSQGVPLRLALRVSGLSTGCAPLAGVMVDVWHCDATGRYSGSERFLRGYQLTDSMGMAQFTTIYPGWYEGRAVHIHFKLRSTTPDGRRQEFTSQIYFDDALSDRVYASRSYPPGGAGRRMRNERDFLYRSGGSQLLADARQTDGGYDGGYTAAFDIGLDFTT
jgi:protocatechuate 3,4-dioxygenase beta subunit